MHTIIVHIFNFKYMSCTQNRAPEDVYSKMHTEKCILKNAYLKNVYFLNYLFMLSRLK